MKNVHHKATKSGYRYKRVKKQASSLKKNKGQHVTLNYLEGPMPELVPSIRRKALVTHWFQNILTINLWQHWIVGGREFKTMGMIRGPGEKGMPMLPEL